MRKVILTADERQKLTDLEKMADEAPNLVFGFNGESTVHTAWDQLARYRIELGIKYKFDPVTTHIPQGAQNFEVRD